MSLIPGLKPVKPLFNPQERTASPGKFRPAMHDSLTDTKVIGDDVDTLAEAWEQVHKLTHGDANHDPYVFNDKGEHVTSDGEKTVFKD